MNNEIAKIDAHIIDDIRIIITRARNTAYQSINEILIRSNWEIGKLCARACKILLGPI